MFKHLIVACLSISLWTLSVHALEIKTEGVTPKEKITVTKISNSIVRIKVKAKIINGTQVLKEKYISIAMLGTKNVGYRMPTREMDGKTYYLYYVNQVLTDGDGYASFDFNVEVSPVDNAYYFIFSAKGIASPTQITEFLPPIEVPAPQPMQPPGSVTSNSSGGISGGSGTTPIATPIPTENPLSFPDVNMEHWAYPYVSQLFQKGIVKGDTNGAIRPHDSITREELAVVLVGAFAIPLSKGNNPLDDHTSLWAKDYVTTLADHGIMRGDEQGNLNGQLPATRAQVVTMLERADTSLSAGDPQILEGFGDKDNIPDYSKEGFIKLIKQNIITGYEDGMLRPNNQISRAELFTLVSKIIKRRD